MKERFTLPEQKVVPYLEGEYTLAMYQDDLRAKVRRAARRLWGAVIVCVVGGRMVGGKAVVVRASLAERRGGGTGRWGLASCMRDPYIVTHGRPRCAALQGKSEADVEKAGRLFTEIQQQIDSKQLKPGVRTQYMRSAFQVRGAARARLLGGGGGGRGRPVALEPPARRCGSHLQSSPTLSPVPCPPPPALFPSHPPNTQYTLQMGHDRTVSFTLDTNLVMIKENPEGHPSCAIAGRW